ncbi:GNAT family N-acetyltransferase [Streptomyces sp. H27-D2]|uniref:GNAT family N-acetyltransferase n=1 Tax=Streptomyces sp. H27-D2 TaxID=3046304 RepID=UPI002DBC9DBB|nr:GNAT family N-acetyltransferase [Streptomyces sp. H27-D2]MEC4015681.1 GNAT family N-acetyltransferase [Streptomyces sp. H27-D2]
MSLEVRKVTDSELADWLRAVNVGFLRQPVVSEEEVAIRRGDAATDRRLGAFDEGRCVATYRSFVQRLSVPGGGSVAANAVSAVTVSPTHRRRGLLSRMITEDQAQAKERGDAVSTLIAAEYPIYGRYGFGPASWTTEWQVEAGRAGLDPRWSGPEDGGRVDFVDGADVRALGPKLHERMSAVRHGVIDRTDRKWQLDTGALRIPSLPWTEPFHAVYRDASGEVQGLLSYTSDDRWEAKLAQNTATVDDLIAVTPDAERALWRFLLSVDWITTVNSGYRAPDDLLPLLLGNPRAARVRTHADFLWLRPLDVPALLEARSYPAAGSLVLEVHDRAGLAAGRYRLDAGPDGASCAPTTESAHLALDVGELGALYLGDESAVRLAALGRVSEERPGAAARAEALLRTARRPWCPDIF